MNRCRMWIRSTHTPGNKTRRKEDSTYRRLRTWKEGFYLNYTLTMSDISEILIILMALGVQIGTYMKKRLILIPMIIALLLLVI